MADSLSQMCLLEDIQFSFQVSRVCECLLHLREHIVVREHLWKGTIISLTLTKLGQMQTKLLITVNMTE